MYSTILKSFDKNFKVFETIRFLSSTEISTALRPFYFSVHPDLFGQHPNQRTVNENSLKQLSSYIESIQSRKPIVPCNLHFYLREIQNSGVQNHHFQEVNINLNERDLRNTIHKILKTCNLSTKYLDNISPQINNTSNRPNNINYRYTPQEPGYQYDFDINDLVRVRRKVNEARDSLNLRYWLDDNYKDAREKYEATLPMRKDIEKMCNCICKTFSIKEVKWDCGWNETILRGCLQSFLALARDHPKSMELLKGRILVFAPFTGLSLDGHIMLNSGEVRHNWLDLINNISKHDKVLLRIPAFEKALSQVLRDIKVVRRKFMPKVLAEEYEKNLVKLMTTLGDYRGLKGYPENWPDSLEDFEIVVETEAGPLMVSPTGQFIVPSTCPGFLLVNFITDNIEEARKKANEYKQHKYIEKSLHLKCIIDLQLADLKKDDNVTPEVMIQCCERLLKEKNKLTLLKGLNLSIGTYYSVLSNGTVCIPWNWT